MNDKRYPNLYLIGFPKCATTSMYSMLADHPDIHSSGLKKPDYFMFKSFESLKTGSLHEVERYRIDEKSKEHPHQRFDRERYLQSYAGGENRPYRLDASHYSNFKDVARCIAEVSPDARFIAMVREPVDRFYSHFLMVKRQRRPDQDFEGYLEECLQLEQEYASWQSLVRTPLGVGLYHEYLLPYVEAFGRDHVHILRYEDFKKDKQKAFDGILEFLGLQGGQPLTEYKRSLGGRHRHPALGRLEKFLLHGRFRALRGLVPRSIRTAFRSSLRKQGEAYVQSISDKDRERLLNFYYEDQKAFGQLFGDEHCYHRNT